MGAQSGEHVGYGIVVFRRAVDIEESFVSAYVDYLHKKDTAQKYLVNSSSIRNEGGYEFTHESMNYAPIRYNNTVDQDTPQKYRDFIQLLENTNYDCLVEYCKLFPVATEAVTWKTRGHLAVYSPGQGIGCHSDSAVPLVDWRPAYGQSALHNTLTCGMSLSSEYTGGDLYFRLWDIGLRLEIGDVAIYPSSFIGAHEVKPIESGKRIAYLQWFCHGDTGSMSHPNESSSSLDSSYFWLTNLKNDVGSDKMYQQKVV